MLDLLFSILKFCSILTLLRLTSTAFGWEFGVSRQYLRLLELLFHLGQKRIEKVESEQKLNFSSNNQTNEKHEESSGEKCEFKSSDASNDNLEEDNQTTYNACQYKSKADLVDKQLIYEEGLKDVQGTDLIREKGFVTRPRRLGIIQTLNKTQTHKTRRISTPDGPPVFLLDNDDSESGSEDDGEDDDDDSNADDHDDNCDCKENKKRKQFSTKHHRQIEFHLDDANKFVFRGIDSIIEDQVTKRFTQEELKTWNLLTRTNAKNYQFMSRSLGLYWLFGFIIRYTILMPLRIMFTLAGAIWLISTMTIVGFLPKSIRYKPHRLMSLMSFRMLSCGITSRLKFHNRQFRAKNGDMCVANHTSPIDVVLLACDNCYALVGQRHGGLLGILEHALSRATNHVWFDRGQIKDRKLVTEKLRQHLSSKTNLPVLIFPEGTCINNSAVMMFRKGGFEITDKVCPVAIKYDPRFGDPFWNSSKQSYLQYLLLMMSSWAIKCDVWYLPPMHRLEGECSAEFAARVKSEIARQGGLVDLAWDGQLKRSAPKEAWKVQQQEDFVKRLKLE